MINVTKTYLPDRDKYKSYVDAIFDSGWLTNNGQFTKQLQRRLSDYLGVRNLLPVSNGTLALQVAYKLLDLKGDVLTTPFSFVATTSSLVWEGLNPVFVDIDSSLNMDPKLIEKSITPHTTGIVATHVYGNACDIEMYDYYAKKYNLKVIYDAAHAFGVRYKEQGILNFGDVSAISFHSTKIFHTIEGGALAIRDDRLFERARRMINFGIASPTDISGVGINTKLNEFQAAMGLCVLDEMESIMLNRRLRYERYLSRLANVKGLEFQHRNPDCSENYSHFPVIFDSERTVLQVVEQLNRNGINPRRYFYPSLDTLDYISVTRKAERAGDIACRVLCLPLFDSLEETVQETIIDIVTHLAQ